jgi:NAD+ synthase
MTGTADADLAERVEPDTAAAHVRRFLRAKREETGADGYVLGVSGGLDSAVAAHLAVGAVGAERLTGMVLPGAPSSEANMADARGLCASLGIETIEASIEEAVAEFRGMLPSDLGKLAVGNVRARVRAVALYERANAATELVVGPDNRSEYLLGYFTKYGDGAADVRPLGDLYKTEVYDLAEHLGVDEQFIEKTPTAELWAGQTDEGEIGAGYGVIDTVLSRVVDGEESVEDVVTGSGVDRETAERLLAMYQESQHKRSRPPTPGLR